MVKRYRLHGTEGYVQDMETMGIIPNDPRNRDWRRYQKWLTEGNVPDPWKTKEELEEEEHDALIQEALQKEEEQMLKQRRLTIIGELKKEGRLPHDYKVM